MRGFSLAAAFAGFAVLAGPILDAQSPAAPPAGELPSFEVAAVKPNKSGAPMIRFGMLPGGRFTAENVPLRELLRFAFQVQPFQIENLPGWANSDRFDITAKADGDIAPTQPGQVGPIQFMMRALLAERFGLVYHNETRDMPISAIVLARADGKLGPKLEKSTLDCAAIFAARRGGGPGGPGGPGGRAGGPPPGPDFSEKMQCGFRVGPGVISGGTVPISQLASFLAQSMGRTVVDKTGLEGNYTFDLVYTPDQVPQLNGQQVGAGGGPAGLPPIDPNGPSLSTALQEQLGLKLDSQRGPVTMFVVDKVSQPTPD
jgi:bla regulator protein blaR1